MSRYWMEFPPISSNDLQDVDIIYSNIRNDRRVSCELEYKTYCAFCSLLVQENNF